MRDETSRAINRDPRSRHLSMSHYRNDTWTLDDGLGLGRAGDQVARLVLEVDPPFTVGVTGKWGSGKTSVMRRAFVTLGGQPIEQRLMLSKDTPKEVGSEGWQTWVHDSQLRPRPLSWPKGLVDAASGSLCVWYSPWQHQNEPNPLVPLIGEVRAQFTAWLTGRKKISDRARRAGLAVGVLLERAADVALSLHLGKPGQVATGTLDEMRKAWRSGADDDGLTGASDGQRFHLLFEDAVNELLEARTEGGKLADGARLVIFVDDLDRCDGSVVVRLLEIIKLYLGTRRCVFVLGLDDSAVLEALRAHRSPSEEGNREYLEKLFQATVSVPLPAERQVRDAVAGQLGEHDIPRADDGGAETLRETEDARALLAEDIERLLEPNPRKIKNFVNSLCAAWGMHDCGSWIPGEPDFRLEARRFVALHYLRQFHRPVWRLIERQPEAIRILLGVLNNQPGGTEAPIPGWHVGLVREIFIRSFVHVLEIRDRDGDDPDDRKAPPRHGRQALDEAVTAALERRDRHRSDANFRAIFLELFEQEEPADEAGGRRGWPIDPRHLYLVVPEPGRLAPPVPAADQGPEDQGPEDQGPDDQRPEDQTQRPEDETR